MVKVAPSILSANFANLQGDIEQCQKADMLHVDVMDGRFVPNITIGPAVVQAISKVTTLPLDVHLMIVEPERYVQSFIDAGAQVVTVHAETCTHLHRTLAQIQEGGAKAGVAVNPATSLDFLSYVLDVVDLVLVMTVNPGFGGQSFISGMIPKLRVAKEVIASSGSDILLEVDGGINPETAKAAASAGADILVAGSAVFGTTDIDAAIRRLKTTSQ